MCNHVKRYKAMTMKRLFRHTTTIILRTAMLLGAMIFVNTHTKAQTAAQWAEMPDAFETVDPTTVDWSQEPYFYIQFNEGDVHSFLGEYGLSEVMRAKDYVPFSKSIQWTLVPTGANGEYYLKSLNGNYVRQWPSNDAYCGASSTIDDGRYKFTLTPLSDGYYELDRGSYCLGRENGYEWGRIRVGFSPGSPRARLRFARLKSNIAHVIYYREEGPYTSNALDNPSDETRHYLTYSETAESSLGDNWWWSNVSSRQSIIPKDKSLWTLPTVAAYHLDGLWTLEKADVEGNFYIKKYGTSQYLNEDQHNDVYGSELGGKDASKGTYILESPNNNRYTRVQNVKYVDDNLTSDMFYNWNGYGSDANPESSASVDFHINEAITAQQAAEGYTVVGTSTVEPLVYANLDSYQKMVINGTPDMRLRILMSRQENNSTGPYLEKEVTIGRDGKAMVDLTDLTSKYGQAAVKMTYVNKGQTEPHGQIDINSDAAAYCGYNKISGGKVALGNESWGVNNIAYLEVDASAFNGTIKRVTLTGDFQQISARNMTYGVGYNSTEWSSDMTWDNADFSITTMGETQTVNKVSWDTSLSFDITDAFREGKKMTILVYQTAAGGGYIKHPRVEVEYVPNVIDLDVNYAHLNAIKTGWYSPAGTITGITLAKMSDQNTRYLHHAHGDGWQVLQWSDESTSGNDWWYAGFLPVEVPASKKDDYYGVLLKVKRDGNKIRLTGGNNNVQIESSDNLYSGTFTPTEDLTNVFQLKNMPTGCYEKIVIKFGSAVPAGWNIHAYGEQSAYESLEGKTEYEITLDPSKKVDDFTIFNWFGVRSSITITECYFTPATPSCDLVEMLNYEGGTDVYSEDATLRKLWKLEQVDDYAHFRLKSPDGRYFQDDGKMTGEVNDAKIFTNTSLLEKFDLKWFYIDPAVKEHPVNYKVTHRMSYLKDYAYQYREFELDKQGLATDAQSDWWNYDKGTQKVNHFEITHYVKRNETKTVEFPTILNNSSDHIYYQRWYHYNDETCDNNTYPDGTDINGLKSHVSLDVGNNVQYFLYSNGIVTGEKLKWDGIEQGNFVRHVNRNFKFTNSDGKNFTVAADVSRYSDMTYKGGLPTNGDLEEPSLTMRYIYMMKDAKVMAKMLTECTSETGKWLEKKTFHFPAKQIHYENKKKAGYRGEFIGLRHVFSDYWVFSSGNPDDTDDNHLVSAVIGNTNGRIEVEIVDDPYNPTNIRKGGYVDNANYDRYGFDDWSVENDYKGFYLYDMMDNKNQYGDSRFIVFRYPASKEVTVPTDPTVEQKALINVYLKDEGNNKRYQLAQFTIIFDPGTVTLPYTSVDGSAYVKADDNNPNPTYKERDPKKLVEKAGKPIAKITFDYPYPTDAPTVHTYHYPEGSDTRHAQGNYNGGTISNSSPVPLTFDKTNYAFDGDNANWGSYAMVGGKSTVYGKWQKAEPANDATYGYGIEPDKNFKSAFLYIDASEQPGDICSAPFVGDFCTGDRLMFSGWISGSNAAGESDNRCPGGVTLTVKGEHNLHNADGTIMYDDKGNPKKDTVTLYRFCPGQVYELDDGVVEGVSYGIAESDRDKYHVVWQQFYFEFVVNEKYDRHWIEVNNNCVSSKGGDFMLDNIEVYAIVPEVIPSINTPLCVKKDGTTEMRLLKLRINYNKLKSSRNVNGDSAYEGFVFLDKNIFLDTFRTELRKLTDDEKTTLHLGAFNFTTITLDELADAIEDGQFSRITGDNAAYQKAFDAAILGNKTTWYSHSNDPEKTKMNSSIMYFRWSTTFEDDVNMPLYSFADAVNKNHAVYREIDNEGEKWVVMNGNFPELQWKTNTDYYIINTPQEITPGHPFTAFNLCSECSKASVFRIEPPYTVLGLEKSDGTDDYVVCEGQIPTVVLNLKGYDLKGNPVDMKDLNFDWWLGDNSAEEPENRLATLDNYHAQEKDGFKLDESLAALRSYYPSITSLNGVIEHLDKTPNLKEAQVLYLKELVDAGQLVLHQSSISVPAERVSKDDPYFYLVACPIHDDAFNQALNPQANQYVAYFCDEPQGLRIKVGQKAPTLKTGFVPNEHGFSTYDYAFPAGSDPVLSIRLAKKEQFETVKNEANEVAVTNDETGEVTYSLSQTVNYLWLPIRNAKTESADMVIKKSKDDNIYLASTNDPTWDKKISKEMRDNGLLPIVGRIVQLTAINTKDNSEGAAEGATLNVDENANNRLCVYFTKNFDVREGYNYTLSLPFQEQGDVNTCDGTILINLKIVPDYEVWTGAAGNTDWNNDENWRRADGNTEDNSGVNGDELYRANAATNSPLYGNKYMTNYDNYRSSKDRIFRKGFAPLYCTHILMRSDEWGNAPVLYDAIDGHNVIAATSSRLVNSPFPNLRDTSTPILKFDMQARRYDMWKDTYGTNPDRGSADRTNDLIAEMYQINSCDEIAMQPGTELRNAHLLNYNSAWMEFELDTKRWYLLGSPLQGTISGEWYAPTGTTTEDYAKQMTTYYDDVKFGDGYDRYSPAIYQRSWDKAKAMLYEVESAYSTSDDSQTENLGYDWEGGWNNSNTWVDPTGAVDASGADDYLDRLGYKPFGAKKANVAIKGIWSNTYNDAQVDYATGGFSVMVLNHLKGNDADVKAIIRLPKEDVSYQYWNFDKEDGSGTNTNITDVQTKDRADGTKRATNRGRLKTDLLLPTQDGIQKQEKEASTYRYGDRRTYTRIPIKEADLNTMNSETFSFTEKVAAGASNLGYYLVENPFPCGLDMTKFFAANSVNYTQDEIEAAQEGDDAYGKTTDDVKEGLEKKYWILTKGDGQNPRQVLVQQAGNEWVSTTDESKEYLNPEGGDNLTFYPHAVVAPGQGFFVQAATGTSGDIDIKFNKDMQVQSRFGVIDGNGRTFTYVIGQSQRTKKMYDANDDGIPETDVPNPDNYEGGELIMVDHDSNPNTPDISTTVVIVPLYTEQDDPDNPGQTIKIPVLDDITETVKLYNYKQATLTLSDQSTVKEEYPLRTRNTVATSLAGLVITAKRDNSETCALVMQREGASNDFLPSEDTEAFITSDFESVSTVYTLCGRLATTINTIHDFRSLPIGVESTSDAPCTLTFRGVEMLGDSIAFYDAVKQELTPLKSGMQFKVSGQTQNRYYLVRSLIQEEAAAETHLQIFTEGLTAKVIASTDEPIVSVRSFDTAGRLIHTAKPQTREYSFVLPRKGIYIIDAQTEDDRKSVKVMAR